jgi:hypothetical protein
MECNEPATEYRLLVHEGFRMCTRRSGLAPSDVLVRAGGAGQLTGVPLTARMPLETATAWPSYPALGPAPATIAGVVRFRLPGEGRS